METQANIRPRTKYSKGAADICRTFMESEGWLQLERIARGEEHRVYLRTAFGTKRALVTPDFDTRLAAYKILTSYGYGRPAELAAADDSGRTVTDLILAALRSPRVDEARAE